jgi:hypothetical protein
MLDALMAIALIVGSAHLYYRVQRLELQINRLQAEIEGIRNGNHNN